MENQLNDKHRNAETESFKAAFESNLSGQIGTMSWGAVFVWGGVVLLIGVNSGIALMGVGIILLGTQFVRRNFKLKPEWFWVTVGLFFVVGSLWQIFGAKLPVMPIILIITGIAIIASAVKGIHFMRH